MNTHDLTRTAYEKKQYLESLTTLPNDTDAEVVLIMAQNKATIILHTIERLKEVVGQFNELMVLIYSDPTRYMMITNTTTEDSNYEQK